MKPKLLFLAKFLGYALVLFALWHPVSEVYLSILNHLIGVLNSTDNYVSGEIGAAMGKMSLYLVPLFSLIAATPGLGLKRKAVVIASGTGVFLLADLLLMEYVLVVRGGNFRSSESAVYTLYTNIKWLLPFLVWIITCYPFLSHMFRPKADEGHADYACPLCSEAHVEIMAHIREAHGEKSLRMKKVRRFISDNPQLSG